MANQGPLSPARLLYEELRENEDAGSFDSWPAPHEADDQVPAQEQTLPDAAAAPAISPNKVAQILTVDAIAIGDSVQPRSALAAIIRLQSTEIEHLVLENDRLAVRLSAVHQFHQNEQNQRRDLERQLREARARNQPPAPAFDVEEIRRAAREGMSAEIKPVLVAILDLLETTLPRGAEAEKPAAEKPAAEKPAAVVGGTPESPPASLTTEPMNDFHRLPEILTRPLEELMSDPGDAGSTPRPVADLPTRIPPREPRTRHEVQSSAMPSVFAWTNLFS